MKYLITGGAGFIGSHVAARLALFGAEVIVVDDLSSGRKENIPESAHFIREKIQNINNTTMVDVDAIIHLAAQASVPLSIENYFESSSNNLLGTLKVFDLSKQLNVPVVYASSSAIYGNLPIGDELLEKYDILSPYAQDKLTMEDYARMSWSVFKVPSIGLRFFNVYGPKQDPNNPYSGVIPIFINRLIHNESVIVNGGYQTRDFIYVVDVVTIIIESLEYLINNPTNLVMNVGTGKSVSVDQLLSIISEELGCEPQVIRKELPQGDPEKSDGTYLGMQKILGTDLRRLTSLASGIKLTVNDMLNGDN